MKPTLLALAAAAALLACGRDDARAPATGNKAAEPAVRHGGLVRLPSAEPTYLNPILEPRFVVANSLVYEGLVGLDARLEPTPRLAQSWAFSDDGRTLTFQLRDDVRWHDGSKFTAADVAFTFEAIRATAAQTAWRSYMAPVRALTTPDERTVVVTYAEPFAPALVSWTVGILQRRAFAGDGGAAPSELAASPANLEPVGTGPFKVVRWELGKRLLLEANEAWWHRRPLLDGVELVFGITEADTLAALQRGQVDWARVADVGSWLEVTGGAEFRDAFEASELVESRLRLLAWNTGRPALADRRVRTALTHALDRGRVITDVLFGQAQALAAPMFPTMFGHDPSLAPLPFDLAAARRLLAEAAPAGPDGVRLRLEVLAPDSLRGPATDGMFAIFRRDLASVGVELKLTVLPAADYYARVARRDYDAVYFGWLPDIPDPDPAALVHSSQAQAGANYAALASPEVDALVERARRTIDRDARKALYGELARLLVAEMPYTPLFAPVGRYAWTRRLHGVTPRDVGPQAPLPSVAAWWIEKP